MAVAVNRFCRQTAVLEHNPIWTALEDDQDYAAMREHDPIWTELRANQDYAGKIQELESADSI